MSLQLPSITLVKRTPLLVLHLEAGKATVYHVHKQHMTLVKKFDAIHPPSELAQLVTEHPSIPWVVLVDQSEEMFLGDVMPILRGAAKRAWLTRLSEKYKIESPYHIWQVQGKSRSESDKLYVLGYALGRAELITEWLDALRACRVRLRGMYSPALLTLTVMKHLRIAPTKNSSNISVLVTFGFDGLRQTVLEGGRIRFSRLALLNTQTNHGAWRDVVYKESTRLREYLINAQLLPSDQAAMNLYVVQPLGTPKPTQQQPSATAGHPHDIYVWLQGAKSIDLYLHALVQSPPWQQLAPRIYRQSDQILQIISALSSARWLIGMLIALSVIWMGSNLWGKYADTQLAAETTRSAQQEYQTITKTFPKSPLTTAQLLAMRKQWENIQANTPPEMKQLLTLAGQTLERHPAIVLEEISWALSPAPSEQVKSDPASAPKKVKEVATLLLKGSIQGIANDDLRGTRDVLTKAEADFKQQSKIQVEVIRRPLDLSSQASLSGSSKQERSELNFELKLWQQ